MMIKLSQVYRLHVCCRPRCSNIRHQQRNYSNRMSFVNLEGDEDSNIIHPEKFTPVTTVDDLEIDSFRKSLSHIDVNSMINDNRVSLKTLPTWYERINSPSNYKICHDIISDDSNKPYRNFDKCYLRVLEEYANEFMYISKESMDENLMNYPKDREIPEKIKKQHIKCDMASKRLNEISSNYYIIYNRHNVARKTAPFYLHQQFLIYLNEKNASKLTELYFELPDPKPIHLNRREFERFMSFLLNLKISEDHKFLLPKIINIFEDIKENGNGIMLTDFENTKHLSFLLSHWNNEGLSPKEKMTRITQLTHDKKWKFCPGMWNIVLSHLPEYSDEIMQLISNELPVTRTSVASFMKYIKDPNQFDNLLELMKMKYFHLDAQLFATIVHKYVEFGKFDEALLLVKTVLTTMDEEAKNTENNWKFLTLRDERKQLFKFDILNKAFFQFFLKNPKTKFKWLRYRFKPNPLAINNLLFSLGNDNSRTIELLKLMERYDIPLVNKQSFQLLNDANCDLPLLSITLKLMNSSIKFNLELHKVAKDSFYDTEYLSNFISDSDNDTELKQLFHSSLKVYQAHLDSPNTENYRGQAAQQLVTLNEFLNGEKRI